jgi:hypothetical protein
MDYNDEQDDGTRPRPTRPRPATPERRTRLGGAGVAPKDYVEWTKWERARRAGQAPTIDYAKEYSDLIGSGGEVVDDVGLDDDLDRPVERDPNAPRIYKKPGPDAVWPVHHGVVPNFSKGRPNRWEIQPEQCRQPGESFEEFDVRLLSWERSKKEADQKDGFPRARELAAILADQSVDLETKKSKVHAWREWAWAYWAPISLERDGGTLSWMGSHPDYVRSSQWLRGQPEYIAYETALAKAREGRRAPRVRDRREELRTKRAEAWLDAQLIDRFPKAKAAGPKALAKLMIQVTKRLEALPQDVAAKYRVLYGLAR